MISKSNPMVQGLGYARIDLLNAANLVCTKPPVCETLKRAASQLTRNYMPVAMRHGSKAGSFTKTGKSLLQISADAHLADRSGRAIGHFVTKSEQDPKYLPAKLSVSVGRDVIAWD